MLFSFILYISDAKYILVQYVLRLFNSDSIVAGRDNPTPTPKLQKIKNATDKSYKVKVLVDLVL